MELHVTAFWPLAATTILFVKVAFCPKPVTKIPRCAVEAVFSATVLLVKRLKMRCAGDIQSPAPLPAKGRIVDDNVLHNDGRVVGTRADPAAVIVCRVSLNQIALNQRTTEVGNGNPAAAAPVGNAVVRNGVPDDLGIPPDTAIPPPPSPLLPAPA